MRNIKEISLLVDKYESYKKNKYIEKMNKAVNILMNELDEKFGNDENETFVFYGGHFFYNKFLPNQLNKIDNLYPIIYTNNIKEVTNYIVEFMTNKYYYENVKYTNIIPGNISKLYFNFSLILCFIIYTPKKDIFEKKFCHPNIILMDIYKRLATPPYNDCRRLLEISNYIINNILNKIYGSPKNYTFKIYKNTTNKFRNSILYYLSSLNFIKFGGEVSRIYYLNMFKKNKGTINLDSPMKIYTYYDKLSKIFKDFNNMIKIYKMKPMQINIIYSNQLTLERYIRRINVKIGDLNIDIYPIFDYEAISYEKFNINIFQTMRFSLDELLYSKNINIYNELAALNTYIYNVLNSDKYNNYEEVLFQKKSNKFVGFNSVLHANLVNYNNKYKDITLDQLIDKNLKI